MIVDIHTHTFPDAIAASTVEKLKNMSHTQPFTDGSNGDLAASMVRAGVDRSVVLPVATSPRQVRRINDCAAQVNRRYGQTGIFSLGGIHPDYPDWRGELDRAKQLGLKGIKIHPVYQGVDLDDIRYLRILERCGQLGLVVVAHAGLDVGFPGQVNCTPKMILHALNQVGPIRLLLAHMGGWRQWDQVEELLTDTGVCLDTSYCLGRVSALEGYYAPDELELMEEGQFMRMVRSFGAHRILFGTDSPWGGQAEKLALLRALPLTSEELAAIQGENARRLLDL